MKRSVIFVFSVVAIFAIGCSSTPRARSAPAAPSTAPASTTCIGDQCGGAVFQPAPVVTAVPLPPSAPTSTFVVEIDGVQKPVTAGMQLEVGYERMTPIYNRGAKPDCSNVRQSGLSPKPGPVCVVWADMGVLKLKKGDVKPVSIGLDGSPDTNFTVVVK